jgi:hypothetical protein
MENKKTLHLNLKKKWFDMILSGEKKAEYRNITSYWLPRLFVNDDPQRLDEGIIDEHINELSVEDFQVWMEWSGWKIRNFDTVTFSNGMTPPVPRFEIELDSITVDTGMEAWGATVGLNYFVLNLGEII